MIIDLRNKKVLVEAFIFVIFNFKFFLYAQPARSTGSLHIRKIQARGLMIERSFLIKEEAHTYFLI